MRAVKDAISSNVDRRNTGTYECCVEGEPMPQACMLSVLCITGWKKKKPTHRHLVKTLSKMGSYCRGGLARVVRI